jgi:hypothetical protein
MRLSPERYISLPTGYAFRLFMQNLMRKAP